MRALGPPKQDRYSGVLRRALTPVRSPLCGPYPCAVPDPCAVPCADPCASPIRDDWKMIRAFVEKAQAIYKAQSLKAGSE